MKIPSPQSTTGLWKLAFLIFATGGLVAYLIYRNDTSLDATAHLRLTILITAVAGGLCVICATANLWLKR